MPWFPSCPQICQDIPVNVYADSNLTLHISELIYIGSIPQRKILNVRDIQINSRFWIRYNYCKEIIPFQGFCIGLWMQKHIVRFVAYIFAHFLKPVCRKVGCTMDKGVISYQVL